MEHLASPRQGPGWGRASQPVREPTSMVSKDWNTPCALPGALEIGRGRRSSDARVRNSQGDGVRIADGWYGDGHRRLRPALQVGAQCEAPCTNEHEG